MIDWSLNRPLKPASIYKAGEECVYVYKVCEMRLNTDYFLARIILYSD